MLQSFIQLIHMEPHKNTSKEKKLRGLHFEVGI